MSNPPDTTATAPRPASVSRYDTVRLSHGSGGQATLELIEQLFVATFANGPLRELTDAAILDNLGGRLAFATDSHTVKPAVFPGGDIGRLAVAGTINDLAVMGARPAYLSAAFLLEEGYDMRELERVVQSMKATADEAGVTIVAGDTKVLGRGHGDGIFVNTTGIGFLPDDVHLGADMVRPGDKVLVNGTLGDHGIAVMSRREGLDLAVDLVSDVAPLNGLIDAVRTVAPGVRFMRDVTRGGLAAVANEVVMHRPFGLRVFDVAVPIDPLVEQYSEMLGIDPLLAANEGKVMMIVPPAEAEAALGAMKAHPYGREAAIIGDIVKRPEGVALVETAYGSHRVLEMPIEEQLPRIC
ncbi:MAG: hydrogenase expression/formation protein HypE [Trueperaceae bacterium]|nr:hydrogenase expression/formation protein HypE [Trueperaceae bacterium]